MMLKSRIMSGVAVDDCPIEYSSQLTLYPEDQVYVRFFALSTQLQLTCHCHRSHQSLPARFKDGYFWPVH